MIYTYDIETYPNHILFVFINTMTPKNVIEEYTNADMIGDTVAKAEALSKIDHKIFIIGDDRNDVLELDKFVHNTKILVGFNSLGFDDLILDMACILREVKTKKPLHQILYEYAQIPFTTMEKLSRWNNEILKNYQSPYISVDMQKLLYLDVKMVSLKRCQIILKWYRVETLPIEPDTVLDDELKAQCLDYCINDVLSTNELYWNKIDEVKLRFDISKEYGINVYSRSRSGIAKVMLSKMYLEMSGISNYKFRMGRTERRIINFADIIDPNIKYKTKEFNKLLEHVKTIKFHVGAGEAEQKLYNYRLMFNGVCYSFKTGGIHTEDSPDIFNANDTIEYRDADIGSFYPTFVINQKVSPKHLDASIFRAIAKIVTKDRLDNKHLYKQTKVAKYKTRMEALKITANAGLFGMLGDQNSPFYDLKAMFTVTINGQLYILTLAEDFAINNIQVISANTDGVLCKVKKDQVELYDKIVKDWQLKNNMELEITHYSKYIRQDVNNYIAITTDNEVKKKGVFTDKIDFDKGFKYPIVAIALEKYFKDKVPIADTIKNHNCLYDFGISQKVGWQFKLYFQEVVYGKVVKTRLEKVVRVYVSNNGGSLVKVKEDGSETGILAGKTVTIFNRFIKKDMKDYDINYNFYIAQAQKIIDKVNRLITKDITGTKSKPGLTGTLFDGYEE